MKIILILISIILFVLLHLKKIKFKNVNKKLIILLFIISIYSILSIFNNKNLLLEKKEYMLTLTYYYTGDSTGSGTYLPGLGKHIAELGDKAKINSNGWYVYTDNGIDYLMVATATNACLNVTKTGDGCYKYHALGKINGIHYRNYRDTFVISIGGKTYNAMVVDSCGACMKASCASNEKIDILSIKGAKNPGSMKSEIVSDNINEEYNQNDLKTNITISDVTDYNPGTNYTGNIKDGYLFNRLKEEKNLNSNITDDDLAKTVEKDNDKMISEIYNRVVEGLIYHNEAFINQTSGISSPGLSAADATGFTQRISQPTKNGLGGNFYFTSANLSYAGGYTGQCTWYAFGRANEILSTVGSNLKWNIASDAGTWYDRNLALGTLGFKSSNNYKEPKVGAIISWKKNGAAGHVAVIEEVNGNSVVISEANVTSIINKQTNPYGWQRTTLTLEQVKNRWGKYIFSGYIYMLD